LTKPQSGLLPRADFRTIVIGAIVLAILIAGRTFLIPLAIALVVWNLLEAIIAGFTRIKIGRRNVPRWVGVIFSIGLVILVCIAVSVILANQASAISATGPKYIERLESLFTRGIAFVGADVAAMVRTALNGLNLTATISGLVGSAGSFLTNMMLVTLYVAFLLAEQHTVSRKLAALFPRKADEEEMQTLFSQVSEGIRHYMWIKTIMSLLTGATSYAILKMVGVDFAETFALIIFLLNFIPSIGSALGVIFPALLALVQFDTLGPMLLLITLLGGTQFLIGNVIEPMFTGRSLNLSAFVIILCLTFWGAIWGVVGMVLSVPITVMIMIVCAYVPSWRWVAVLLSTDGQVTAIKN